jgi:hypothetical protein
VYDKLLKPRQSFLIRKKIVQEKEIVQLLNVLGLSVSGSCSQHCVAYLNVLLSVVLIGCVKSRCMSAVNEHKITREMPNYK